MVAKEPRRTATVRTMVNTMHDRQEFLIVDLISALGWGVLFRKECHGVENTIIIWL